MGRIYLWQASGPAGQRLSQWANCECRAWCSLLRKVNLPPRGPRPTFRCLRTTFLRRVLSCSLIAMCKPVSKTIFFGPQENEKKDVSPTGVYSPKPHGFRVVWHAFFFHSPNLHNPWGWSLRSDCSIFEAKKTSALCMLNFYDVQCTPAKRPSPWGNPKNQPISELDIFSKRQALSRAVVVNSNMSRGKYLAREVPGSRLRFAHWTQTRNREIDHCALSRLCDWSSQDLRGYVAMQKVRSLVRGTTALWCLTVQCVCARARVCVCVCVCVVVQRGVWW